VYGYFEPVLTYLNSFEYLFKNSSEIIIESDIIESLCTFIKVIMLLAI